MRARVAATVFASVAVLLALFPAGIRVAEALGPNAIVSGFNSTSFPGNDDGTYLTAIPLPFSMNFYGATYNQVYLNNNGNLTFNNSLSTFTPYPLSSPGQPIIAPFFADVDTRVGNVVTFGTGTANGRNAIGFNWPGVGCFSQTTSVLNYFQVLLIDRTDVGAGDFDIEFNYDQIQWDSGQASGGGSSCQGGTSARAGFAGGTGTANSYYELPGSGVSGAFLDSNTATGLVHNSYNSPQLGRYIYAFRNGSQGPASAPTSLSAAPISTSTIGLSAVSVSWGPPTYSGSSPISGYTVEAFGQNGSLLANDTVSASTFQDTLELGADCNASDYVTVFANSSSGSGQQAISASFTPVHVPSSPKIVVIMLMGVGTSLPANAYDPGAVPSYCNMRGSSNADLQQLGFLFDPTGSPTPNLTDSLAALGAVVLPFSYKSAYFTGPTSSSFSLLAYTNDDAGQESGAGALSLDTEIQTASSVWPQAQIYVIGHSEGGLVATEWFGGEPGTGCTSLSCDGGFYTAARNPQVRGIFTVDSPINGIQSHDTLCDALCSIIPPLAHVSGALVEDMMRRWDDRDANDQAFEAKDTGQQAVFSPLGSPGDQIFDLANIPDKGILSQYMCAHAQSNGGPCAPESLDAVMVEPPYPPTGLSNAGTSHGWAFTQPSAISYISNSVSDGSPTNPPTGSPAPPPDPTVSPTVAESGQTVTISGSGLGTTAGQVWFSNGTAGQQVAGTVTAWSDTSISVAVPSGAVSGPVAGATAAGAPFVAGNLVVTAATSNGVATISFSPTSPSALAGQPVSLTLTATNASNIAVPNVVITLTDGPGSTTCTTNASGVCTVSVTSYRSETLVATSGTASTSIPVTWTQPPIRGMTLSSSAANLLTGGSATITATVTDGSGNPVANEAVNFAANGSASAMLSAAQATTNSSGVASVTVSSTTAGSTDVTATTNDSATSRDVGVSWSGAVITGVSPGTGPSGGGTSVTISGSGFTSSSVVYFGSTPASSITFVSATSMTAVSPAGSGAVDIRVGSNGSYTALTLNDVFTYGPPTVTSISPTSGPSTGGTSVTISGTNFARGATVKFGSVTSTSTRVNSATSITAVSPVATAGTVDVTVTTAAGQSATSSADLFTYTAVTGAPTVTQVSPNTGSTSGGTSVTVTGTNFLSGAVVSVGGNPGSNVQVHSGTSLTFVTPSGTGTVEVRVTTANGTSAVTSADQFTYGSPPTVSRLQPKGGSYLGGTSVTITGTNFLPGAIVNFGGNDGYNVVVVSSTKITVTSPPAINCRGGITVDVTVQTQFGVSATSSSDQFSYSLQTGGPITC